MPGEEGGATTKSCASPATGGAAGSHTTTNGGKPRHPEKVADCKGAGLDGGAPAQKMNQWVTGEEIDILRFSSSRRKSFNMIKIRIQTQIKKKSKSTTRGQTAQFLLRLGSHDILQQGIFGGGATENRQKATK